MMEEDKIIEEIVQESLKCSKMYAECVREAAMKALAKGEEIGWQKAVKRFTSGEKK